MRFRADIRRFLRWALMAWKGLAAPPQGFYARLSCQPGGPPHVTETIGPPWGGRPTVLGTGHAGQFGHEFIADRRKRHQDERLDASRLRLYLVKIGVGPEKCRIQRLTLPCLVIRITVFTKRLLFYVGLLVSIVNLPVLGESLRLLFRKSACPCACTGRSKCSSAQRVRDLGTAYCGRR